MPSTSPIDIKYTQLFINNEFVDSVKQSSQAAEEPSSDNPLIAVVNPSDETLIANVAAASAEDVDKAVQAAKAAFYKNGWGKIDTETRSKLLLKLADLVERDTDLLAKMETINVGKHQAEAREDVEESARCFRFYAGYTDKIYGKTYPPANFDDHMVSAQTRIYPAGVVGLITPWNYPLLMAVWKLAPALAAGNCIVLKPSEVAPLSCLHLGSLIKEAGFPPGVVNIISGWGSIAGDALSRHEEVSLISFTGSTNTGRAIMKASSESNLKKVKLELGGKSPLVVFEDADIDKAVNDVWNGAYATVGQNCCAATRLYLHKSIHKTFLEKLKAKEPTLKVGNPCEDPDVKLGPVAFRRQYQKVKGFLEHAVNVEKLEALIGGKVVENKGFFIPPTIFINVPETSKLFKEEIFGPVLCVMEPFESIDEVLRGVNNTEYGLGCGFWTKEQKIAERMYREMQFGLVWHNTYNFNPYYMPFGGMKCSGFGKDLGVESIYEYSIIKSIGVGFAL
ncbi:aldehyde dehydrogenase X [Basidiobolus meristosporus CBS 931.73]|uniref:Aldehyde dehydrogenase X n=2 Tax=Basidiobolus meristosporus CBS 931.73 TaxID=1314790 RepID=A0A1Y1YJ85_9FUNG|nr:aldehyde dehydrogenase X [Basidiobolus meristosporus CBS 931.73]|eukprot:ORX98045.1 aldehyde dehydrogenase X [Basidiobolus meristosporus CBS 931.73]